MTLRICHVVADLHPKSGGPSRTVTHLSDALSEMGVDVSLFSQSRDQEPFIAPENPLVRLTMAQSSSNWRLRLGLPLMKALHEHVTCQPPDIVHTHGLWLPVNHWATQLARRRSIPLIVHPRGMLEPWAIRQRAWKKSLAMSLFQRSDLRSAYAFVATSAMEYRNIRALGFKQPVAIIPNGISFDTLQSAPEPSPQRCNTVLFLSRLHPKKGLRELITAWSALRPTGWRLCIAGPDEGGHLAEMQQLVGHLNLRDQVDFVGEVKDNDKQNVFNTARLFVLPTHSENFGLVVVEALAQGLPVITTKGAPWSGLVKHQCGWWVDIGVDSLIPALRQAMEMDTATWQTMSANCIEYARSFNWADIARQTADTYRWVLGQGDRPDCVITN